MDVAPFTHENAHVYTAMYGDATATGTLLLTGGGGD
jgi:hypothetical protein